MAKRFTDTDKWNRPWFRNLPQAYKLLWLYIIDHCDIAGVWYVDMKMANFKLDCRINEVLARTHLGKQIEILGDGQRWLIKDFVAFQYGENLSGGNRLHAAVISTLEKHGLSIGKVKGQAGGLQAPKVMVKVMVKDKDITPADSEKRRPPFHKPTIEEIKAYCTERKNSVDPDQWMNFYESNGWRVGRNPMKDWKAAVRTWERNRFETSGGTQEAHDWRTTKLPTAKH